MKGSQLAFNCKGQPLCALHHCVNGAHLVGSIAVAAGTATAELGSGAVAESPVTEDLQAPNLEKDNAAAPTQPPVTDEQPEHGEKESRPPPAAASAAAPMGACRKGARL